MLGQHLVLVTVYRGLELVLSKVTVYIIFSVVPFIDYLHGEKLCQWRYIFLSNWSCGEFSNLPV